VKHEFNHWRPMIVGAVWGLLLSVSVWVQPIEPAAKWALGGGLFLNYTVLGALVMLLPTRGPRWVFGALVGLVYSLPGALFTAAPYPLREDIAPFWYQFASGGTFSFFATMISGCVVGLLCALPKVDPPGQRDEQTEKLKEAMTPEPPGSPEDAEVIDIQDGKSPEPKPTETESLLDAGEDSPSTDKQKEAKAPSRIFKERQKEE